MQSFHLSPLITYGALACSCLASLLMSGCASSSDNQVIARQIESLNAERAKDWPRAGRAYVWVGDYYAMDADNMRYKLNDLGEAAEQNYAKAYSMFITAKMLDEAINVLERCVQPSMLNAGVGQTCEDYMRQLSAVASTTQLQSLASGRSARDAQRRSKGAAYQAAVTRAKNDNTPEAIAEREQRNALILKGLQGLAEADAIRRGRAQGRDTTDIQSSTRSIAGVLSPSEPSNLNSSVGATTSATGSNSAGLAASRTEWETINIPGHLGCISIDREPRQSGATHQTFKLKNGCPMQLYVAYCHGPSCTQSGGYHRDIGSGRVAIVTSGPEHGYSIRILQACQKMSGDEYVFYKFETNQCMTRVRMH